MAFKAARVLGHEINDFLFNELTGSGQLEVIALVVGKVIRLMNYVIIVDGATTVTWKNGTTAVSGPMSYAINGGAAPPAPAWGHFQTTAGAALNITLGTTTVKVSGHGNYITF